MVVGKFKPSTGETETRGSLKLTNSRLMGVLVSRNKVNGALILTTMKVVVHWPTRIGAYMLMFLCVCSLSLSLSFSHFFSSKMKAEQWKTHLKNPSGYSWGIFYVDFIGKFPSWNKINFRTPTALQVRKAVRNWKTNEIVLRFLILPRRKVLMFSTAEN